MASGTITGTTSNKTITVRFRWSSTTNKTTNSSNVKVILDVRKSTAATLPTWGRAYFRIKYGSKTKDFYASRIDIPCDGVWRKVTEWDLGRINHKADGTKTLAVSLVNSGDYSGLPGTTFKDSFLSGTIKLPTISKPAPTPATFRITASATDGGTITPAGVVDVPSNSSQVYTMAADAGYSIDRVLVDGVSQGALSSFTFSDITANRTIHAEFSPLPEPDRSSSFEKKHQAKSTGLLSQVRYRLRYVDGRNEKAVVKLYRGEEATGTPFYNGSHFPGQMIPLKDVHITEGEWITMLVECQYEIVGGAWNVDFFEAKDNNTWTHLGYADDQLVGMTANQQIWTGTVDSNVISNAMVIPDPDTPDDQIAFADLKKVGSGVSISSSKDDPDFPHRLSICYTLINKYGPTKPSMFTTFYANKSLVEWTSSNYIQINGFAPNGKGVLAVELYYTDGDAQEPAFLGRVNVPDIPESEELSGKKKWSFNWTGYHVDTASWIVSNLSIPRSNYTGGVPSSKMAAIDGRLYFWGNPQYPYRIWVGGNPGNRFSVAPGTGGGFVDAGPGIGTVIKDVLKFKTQQGASIVTTVTDNQNSSREARFNLVESTISLSNEQSVSGLLAEQVAGAVGCKSEHGAIAAGDGLYTVSRYGLAITTLTMEYNSQLQVMYVSDPIEPVFLKLSGEQLKSSVLHEINGILYMTFGKLDETLDNVIFCYDIGLKAWWTYTIEINEPILNMISIDYEGAKEGLGIVTASGVYLLPTTQGNPPRVMPDHSVLIESGELSTVQPLQAVHHLTQLEFRFDYFIGEIDIIVKMVDQFGRIVTTRKRVRHDELQHQLAEHIRIDQVVESYSITIVGKANFRMTHFIANLYPKPARVGIVNGFNSSQGHGTSGVIRRTFNSYNDLRNTITPEES